MATQRFFLPGSFINDFPLLDQKTMFSEMPTEEGREIFRQRVIGDIDFNQYLNWYEAHNKFYNIISNNFTLVIPGFIICVNYEKCEYYVFIHKLDSISMMYQFDIYDVNSDNLMWVPDN